MKHTYRRKFDDKFEAEQTARGFHLMPNIDKVGPAEVWITTDEKVYWLNVALEGNVDADELLAATGYERIE